MSAGTALQARLANAIEATGLLAGVYDGPPARAAYPYVALDCGQERDWGHKSGDGREVFAAITLWDEEPARLHETADAVEAAALGVGEVADWQLVSLRLVKRRIVRDVAGPWAATIDLKARLLRAQ